CSSDLGKRLPTLAEFFVYADGAPQGNNNNNNTAWSATGNSGPRTTGGVLKAVSCTGVRDAVGNLWDLCADHYDVGSTSNGDYARSEEHTSELQSRENLVCRLLLEKKKNTTTCYVGIFPI